MIYPIPLLLRPKLLSTKNRWRPGPEQAMRRARDLILTAVSLGLMYGIYTGTVGVLLHLKSKGHLVYFPPELPIGLILMFLSGMLLVSNLIGTISSLLMARDLDLILASPISKPRFFLNKFFEIFLGSTWMVVMFGMPAILGFGQAYGAGASFYFASIGLVIPLFTIPVALSIIIVMFINNIFGADRSRELALVCSIFVLIGIFYAAEALHLSNDTQSALKILTVFSWANKPWLPFHWASEALGLLLVNDSNSAGPYAVLLLSTAIALTALSYIALRLGHERAYSLAKNIRRGLRLKTRRGSVLLQALTSFVSPPMKALIAKEYKLFARDLAQAIQLLLLLGICLIYLYNFRILSRMGQIPNDAQLWWNGVLVISNACMGAFVITAVCTRFVFPSISLEGHSLWILQTAPISTYQILRARFWCWYIPVALVSSVIFTSGALAINIEPHIVAISALSSWVICFGIVGIAVGLGAYFANFDWEHPSQLSASFGSLIFMLVSTVLILLNMVPVGLLIFMRTMRLQGYEIATFDWYLSVGITSIFLTYGNFVAARTSLRIGTQALENRKS